MKQTVFIITIILCTILIIGGIMVLTIYDSRTANAKLAINEYREFKSISDDVTSDDLKEIKNLIRETDLIAWRLNQHRLELERIYDEAQKSNLLLK